MPVPGRMQDRRSDPVADALVAKRILASAGWRATACVSCASSSVGRMAGAMAPHAGARWCGRDATVGLSDRADDTAADAGEHDPGDGDLGWTGSRPGNLEDPDADAGVDEQAQLGDREAGARPDSRHQAEQGDVADAE